ncbi:MAG: glycosyltransferase [Chitinivibrionales bacterium]|nr:glycosyltransferase [Chitinivibrionales bacterium]MBD3396546.1 glycosyltransferase [Chitinivibrionales bacterium]
MRIQNLIESYGCAGYLKCLRRRYRTGRLTWPRFALTAARVYLEDNKPKRTRALLDTLDPNQLTIHEDDRYQDLLSRLAKPAPLPGADCSVNMITKNESETIEAALDSADTVADEIVVCDTGSEDDTREKARLYGTVIVRDEWRGDFSRARNRAIDASTCAWILWMDADDRLEQASAEGLAAIWRSGPPQGVAVCVANRIKNAPPVQFLQVRLFPRRDDVRFERAIHEQIMFGLHRAGIPFTRCEHIRIVHTGYQDPREYRRKMRRNQELVARELEKNPGDPALMLALADGYSSLRQTDEAVRAYKQLCESEAAFTQTPDAYIQAHVNIGTLEMARANLHEAKRYLYRSLYLDPKRLESFYYLGRLLLKEGNEEQAAGFFVRAAGPLPGLRMTASNNVMVRLESIYYLSELLLKWQKHDELQDLLASALDQYPMVPRFYTQLARSLFTQHRHKDAAAMFLRSIALCSQKNDEAYCGAAEIFRLHGDLDAAGRYLHAALANGGNTRKIQPLIARLRASRRALVPICK